MARMSAVMASQASLLLRLRMRSALSLALMSARASGRDIPSAIRSRTPACMAFRRLAAESATWYGTLALPTCTSERTGIRTWLLDILFLEQSRVVAALQALAATAAGSGSAWACALLFAVPVALALRGAVTQRPWMLGRSLELALVLACGALQADVWRKIYGKKKGWS
jgi:hypothetical protein